MRHLRHLWLALITLCIVSVGLKSVAAVIQIGASPITDQLTTTATTKMSRIFYDVILGIALDSKDAAYLGLSYSALTSTDTNATSTVAFNSTDTGIQLGYLFGKKNLFTSLTYNPMTKVSYDSGTGSAVELRGTSTKIDIGYNFWITETLAISIKIMYYLPKLTEQVTGSTLTTIAYSRSFLAPCASLYWAL